MASITPIFLNIKNSPTNPANFEVFVGYTVEFNNDDLETKQHYREICQLIGDDTPGDGIDDALHTVLNTITVFDGGTTGVGRFMTFEVPKTRLDEDNPGSPFPFADEIRARVTLVPIPATRESNQVVINGLVSTPISNPN
jgi:hypothetical protein